MRGLGIRKLSTAVSEYTFKQNGPLNSRSGSSGIIATVFGASGFVGRYVTGELGKAGSIVFVAHRGEEYEVRHLKVCGDLGSVQPALFELRDKASVLKAMERSNVVINCVGKEHNTFHYTTEQANVDSARIIAECAKEVGVKKFVHLSCLAAHEHAPSALGRQKWAAEQHVRDLVPHATILRPGPIFGWEDRLITQLAYQIKVQSRMEIYGFGNARFQPVSVHDIAEAVVVALREPSAAGRTYELGGPSEYTYTEFLTGIFEALGKDPKFVTLPAFVGELKGLLMEKLPNPRMTRDTVKVWGQDRVVSAGANTFDNLGIEPRPMEDWLWEITRDHRKTGKLAMKTGHSEVQRFAS